MEEAAAYYGNARPEVTIFLPSQYSRVLEVGCGEGRFLNNLDGHCEYWGVEPSTEASGIALARLYKVLVGSYQDVSRQLPDRYFDLVICNDVVEHMTDHEAFLRGITQKMRDDSYLVGSIPNVRYLPNLFELLIKRDWRYREEGVLDNTHLRFFTEKSFCRSLSECGYTIEKFSGINPLTIESPTAKRYIKKTLGYLLGRDTQFLQFGFRAKYSRRVENDLKDVND